MSEQIVFLFLLGLILLIGLPLPLLPARIACWRFHQNRQVIGLGCILCIAPLILIFPFNLAFLGRAVNWIVYGFS